ncbi:MAG: hypothetical protein ACYCXG_01160 [Acidiferrobacter sp.]
MDISLFQQEWPVTGLVVALWLGLYIARRGFHRASVGLARRAGRPLRLGARVLRHGARDIQRRNRAVLLAQARDETAERVEREFGRVEDSMRRDLGDLPTLKAELLAHIGRLDEDYQKSAEQPPPSPEWTRAVAVIMRLKPGDDPIVTRILANLKGTIEHAHRRTIAAYERAYQKRHRLLRRARPRWRALGSVLHRVDGQLARFNESALVIDGSMRRYEEIRDSDDGLARSLAASAFARFVIAGFILLVAAGGVLVNFHLIVRPLGEMIAYPHRMAGVPAAALTAIVLIASEVIAGLFCFDALRITHIFAQTGAVNVLLRRRLFWVSLLLLLSLASLEALLVFIREQMAVSGDMTPVPSDWQIGGQMMLGFILPCVMAFVAIPLESFVYALRTVAGVMVVFIVRTMAVSLRLTAQIVATAAYTANTAYDLCILPPLLLERIIQYGSRAWFVGRRRRQPEA